MNPSTSIFGDMDPDFMRQIMETADRKTFEEGEILFSIGDPAHNAFFLLKGTVRLSIGGSGRLIHTVNREGEFFGWSSLVGGDSYTATATAISPVTVLSVNRDGLNEVMERNPESGLLLYERIAGVMGARLMHMYDALATAYQLPPRASQAMGQSPAVV